MNSDDKVQVFNNMYHVGTPCIYWPTLGGVKRNGKRVHTTSEAGIVCGNPVVSVAGIGNVSLDHLQHGLHGLDIDSPLFDQEFMHTW